MNNTQQTSLALEPPCLSRSNAVLISSPLPPQGYSKTLSRFLFGVALLHLFLSVGGFIYLYHNDRTLSSQLLSVEGKSSLLSSEMSYKTLARMVVEPQAHMSNQKSAGYLRWDINHSVRRSINYYQKSWLTILQPGDYYVYSRVTFIAKGDTEHPLVSRVKLRKNETGEETVVMAFYCYCRCGSIPSLCTATQGELITLERGNQLSIWVNDMSLVHYEAEASTFGMYKL